jgi:hypothetical protein
VNDSVKYILYSHYGYREGDDFAAYKAGVAPDDLEGVKYLFRHLRGLRELLNAPGHQGLLVLFYAPGYERFLEGLAHQEDDARLLAGRHAEESPAAFDDRVRLRFAKDVAECVQRRLNEQQMEDRVRFLTSFDLRVILGRVNAIFAGQFRRFFIGPAKGLRYDAPKVMEAILRLRVLGNGVPVLRLDHDVIFRGENQDIGDLGLFKAVACAVRAYQLRLAQPIVSTFLFSASYNSRELRNPTKGLDRFEAWSRAFATRIYPALVADPSLAQSICSLPDGTHAAKELRDNKWNEYVTSHLDETLARRFYGLTDGGTELTTDGTAGLTSIGAHPLYSVISGALLCLSEGAILDLPPFSNLGTNVMWIDDHLKYSLHRAMNHFTSGETLNLEPGLSDARLDDVSVTKGRPAVSNLPSYIFETYLPTLLWGAIMDAWITNDPILKCRYASLREAEQPRWHAAKDQQHEAPLPRAMLEALRVGSFDDESTRKLKHELERCAVKRIEEVRQLWAGLKTDTHRTFASYWAEGAVEKAFGQQCFKDCPDDLWKGIAVGHGLTAPIRKLEDLPTSLARKVDALVSDTLAYVHWTLEWPRFVQIVRSIRKGDFVGDLGWQPN